MLTRKKSVGSRRRRARRRQPRFLTPDLVLFAGQKIRFVANQEDALSNAERLRREYAEMDDSSVGEVSHFLQRAYHVAVQFRRRPGDFERFKSHPFWEALGEKPKDASTSKWALYFVMQATTTKVRNRARRYAVLLDGLIHDKVSPGAVAARVKAMGEVEEAYDVLLNARSRRDREKTLRILDDNDGSLFAQMTAVVGRAIERPPMTLPAKVMGEVAAIQGKRRPALPTGGASAKKPQAGSKASPAFRGAPPRGKAQRLTCPAAVGQKRVDPPSRKGNASSTGLKTQRRGGAPKQAPWLPEGIDDRSIHTLHEAIRDLDRQMKEDLAKDVLWNLMEQREHVQDLIVQRKDWIRRQKLTRREKKAAARVKRMGGPLPPAPSPQQK